MAVKNPPPPQAASGIVFSSGYVLIWVLVSLSLGLLLIQFSADILRQSQRLEEIQVMKATPQQLSPQEPSCLRLLGFIPKTADFGTPQGHEVYETKSECLKPGEEPQRIWRAHLGEAPIYPWALLSPNWQVFQIQWGLRVLSEPFFDVESGGQWQRWVFRLEPPGIRAWRLDIGGNDQEQWQSSIEGVVEVFVWPVLPSDWKVFCLVQDERGHWYVQQRFLENGAVQQVWRLRSGIRPQIRGVDAWGDDRVTQLQIWEGDRWVQTIVPCVTK